MFRRRGSRKLKFLTRVEVHCLTDYPDNHAQVWVKLKWKHKKRQRKQREKKIHKHKTPHARKSSLSALRDHTRIETCVNNSVTWNEAFDIESELQVDNATNNVKPFYVLLCVRQVCVCVCVCMCMCVYVCVCVHVCVC